MHTEIVIRQHKIMRKSGNGSITILVEKFLEKF